VGEPAPEGEDRDEASAPPPRGREWMVHVAGVVGGPLLVGTLVGSASVALLWRVAAATLALTLVARGLLHALVIVRGEWRGERGSRRDHRRLLARFAAAFVLVVAATS